MNLITTQFSGWPIHHLTMPPVTTGAWSLANRSDQTISGVYSNSARNTENARRLLLSGTLDVLPAQAVGDYWVADGSVGYSTRDGLHPSENGDIRLVTTFAAFAFARSSEASRMASSPPTLS